MRERSICYDQGYVDIVVVIAMYEVVIILLVLRLLWTFGSLNWLVFDIFVTIIIINK